ncbi:TetR/AcrR family transcriptional regulator [Pseudonocardia sp. MH-G8]|uniref:TetR/AcrR family transcriptional regulator n=1 Tax=Pseudonocardia sp. MH-G8 TaxID=1854588 RepID=UPI001E54B320|nr:TetR/AcrR family transcriptional regulator [Pseudonocardia sp. MH-G8]
MAGTRRATIGRPREFDVDEALERAMRAFWAQGYEGAGLTDLTAAMGITRTSMYAAFGNKENLFRKALQRYSAGPAAYATRALEEPTARTVATAFLHGAVETTTHPSSRPDASACREPWPRRPQTEPSRTSCPTGATTPAPA